MNEKKIGFISMKGFNQ